MLLGGDHPPAGWHAPNGADYGWDNFILLEHDDKREYLYHDLRMQVEHLFHLHVDWYKAHDVLPQLPDGPPLAVRAAQVASAILEHQSANTDGYIDHQSTFSWPLDRETGLPHVGFARWYRDRILDDQVAILGGNDNEDGPRPPGKRVAWELQHDEFSMRSYCHDRDDHWLLWDPLHGVKLRVPKVEGARILRSAVPELVDVKITDQCGRGCRFCYQASTPTGPHSPMWAHEMASVIRGLGVLEVAIGGGEPLEHPEFWRLVDDLHRDVTVNVTTRRLDLIPPWRLDKLGGVGFSAETVAAFEAGLALTRLAEGDTHDNPWRKLVLHVVLGATPMDEVVRICELAERVHLPVLLLGWKEDGRGATFRPHPHDDWPEVLRRAFTGGNGVWQGPRIGVDTPIVERWGDVLRDRLGVDPRLMVGGEGAFSLYLDFVALTVSRASYGPGERVPFPLRDVRQDPRQLARAVLDVYRGWAS